MPTPSPTTRRVLRFGLFEADFAAGELRKNGNRVRLQEQPFQVLAALLETPGDIVTREQLRQKIWPADTFVDFDHSLNTAVNKVREALGDSASNPRFVETLARRGYRFIAPVVSDIATPNTPLAPAASSQNPLSMEIHPELDVPIPHRGLTRGLFVLVQVMYLIFYGEALIHIQSLDRMAVDALPGWAAMALVILVVVTAGTGIPLRCYLISAAAFDHRQLGAKFIRLFAILLGLDELWALAPFLILEKIGLGAALAATAGLVYVPFSERTLIRLAYPGCVANPASSA